MRYTNFFSPAFAADTPSTFYILENVTASPISTFQATDQDSGLAGTVTYFLVGSSAGIVFNISSASGTLSLIRPLDREATSNYTLIVGAKDSAPSPFDFKTTSSVFIGVLDVNDNAPVFKESVMSVLVLETAAVYSAVTTLLATDLDEGSNSELRYSVVSSNDTSAVFRLAQNGSLILMSKFEVS